MALNGAILPGSVLNPIPLPGTSFILLEIIAALI